ncbi:hypothetical protein ACLBKU_16020 [Erythrobacter sp. NE805]
MTRTPSEDAIAREMKEAGLDRLSAIRRIQQRQVLREQLRRPDLRGAR